MKATEQQILAQQGLIASRVDNGTYENFGGIRGALAQADEAVLQILCDGQAGTAIHVGRYRDEETVDASGYSREERHEKGFVVVTAETEKQKVDVFVDVDKARELVKALNRAIRKADPWTAKQANFRRRQLKHERWTKEFNAKQIAAGRMNPDGTWKEATS